MKRIPMKHSLMTYITGVCVLLVVLFFYTCTSHIVSPLPTPVNKSTSVNYQSLLGKRVLVETIHSNKRHEDKTYVEEVTIIELSSSDTWIKVRDVNDNIRWEKSSDLVIVDVITKSLFTKEE
jgi:hypothetical protein